MLFQEKENDSFPKRITITERGLDCLLRETNEFRERVGSISNKRENFRNGLHDAPGAA